MVVFFLFHRKCSYFSDRPTDRYPVLTFDPSARVLVTTAPSEAAPGGLSSEHSFDSRYFDHVYQGPTLRVDLKKELQPIVDCVVGGRSAAVVAYGERNRFNGA